MKDKLYFGAAERKITPEIGCQLYGYSPDVMSHSVNDDLTATAFYFRQGETVAVMISATVCLIQTELSDRILSEIEARFGIPRANCLLHATHTHSGPNVCGTFGWGEIDAAYRDGVFIPAILDAVAEAMSHPVPVRMRVTSGESLVGINRREIAVNNHVKLGQNPWGTFNPQMTVISFADEAGGVVANLVHYGCHGTASGKNHEISRDWAGVMTDVLGEVSGACTAFWNGPEGDVGPRLTNGKTVGEKHVRYAMELGAVAAQDAVRIYRQPAGYHDASLHVSTAVLDVPLGARMALEQAREMYAQFKDYTVNIDGKRGHYYRSVIESYEAGYEEQATRPIPQTVIRLGDVAIVSFPYELFSEVGMRIARASDIPYVLSLSNTNGSEGYFVTEDQICRGGYEVEVHRTGYIQPYADNADHQLVVQTLAHLKRMQGE